MRMAIKSVRKNEATRRRISRRNYRRYPIPNWNGNTRRQAKVFCFYRPYQLIFAGGINCVKDKMPQMQERRH